MVAQLAGHAECEYCDEPGCSGFHVLGDQHFAFAEARRRAAAVPADEGRIKALLLDLCARLDARDEAGAAVVGAEIEKVIAAAPEPDRARLTALVSRVEAALLEAMGA